MKLTRRDALALGLGATAASFLPMQAMAATDTAIAAFTGGAPVGKDGLTLTVPSIAQNGNAVLVAVNAPGAVAIAVFADGNPTPAVATFNFGPLSGAQAASTRIRLRKTQDVIAVARMADGSFVQARQTVQLSGRCSQEK